MAKILTFDCYGTLLNEDGTYDEIEKVAGKIGVDPKLARQRFIAYQDDRNNMHPYIDYDLLTRNNLIHMDYEFGFEHQFERYYVEVLQAHRELTPFPEVIATLQTFIDRGYKLVMMSNSSWDIIPFNAATLKVPFDVWTAEDVHAYKPDLHFFKTIEQYYDLTNDNHIHIAQGYGSDVVPCAEIGWDCIWVNRDGRKPAGEARPTHEVRTLDQVLAYVK